MKIFKVIAKNLKVLIRSKSSALVVILGPLILILLVGLAFSNTSTFTLNIGIYSPEYNNLTNSYVDKLSNENYKISKFLNETECVDNIKNSVVHTCIIFPSDFEITNNKTNEIKFYIDQSQQNFVYAIINTLKSSFTTRSSEVSLDLTTDLIDVISSTYKTINDNKNDELKESIERNNNIILISKRLQSKLKNSEVETSGISNVHESLDTEAKVLRNRITDIYDVGIDILNLSATLFNEGTFSGYNESELDEIEDDIDDYGDTDGPLYQAWNESIIAKDLFVNKTTTLTSSVSVLVESVEDSQVIQKEVIAELKNGLDEDTEDIKRELNHLDTNLEKVTKNILSIEISSAQNIVSPITTKVETVIPKKSNLNYLFPSLLVLLIMFMGTLLSSTLIVMEKNSRAFFRNYTTPTNSVIFVLATFMTSIILMMVQIFIVLSIAALVFKINLLQNVLFIALIVFLISSIFVLLGMVIGYMFNTEQTAMIGVMSLSTIILLTSDMIMPIENMPLYMQEIAKFNPFIVGAEALKKTLFFFKDFNTIKPETIFLSIIILVLFIIIIFIEQITKSFFFSRIGMKKRTEEQKRPEKTKDIFRIDNHLIANKNELYRFIKRLPRKEFKKLVYKKSNRISDFTLEILREKELSHVLSKLKTRWGVLKAIEKDRKIKTKPEEPKEPKKNIFNKIKMLIIKNKKDKKKDADSIDKKTESKKEEIPKPHSK